ncbi:MAG: excinuclease ABC subunit UvrA [Porphyromonadaceae bacterium]|nr:excinuclease ABC subunit UvrA [Porphyromonadaceae bacterium]
MSANCISLKGVRVNNLKNIDLEIPRNRLIVITGLSGSGKSSLAFDTLYAEGQRRYVESLSAYARQFLVRMGKPECDYIKGIPPAIAIEQKVNTRNPRSTVGTSTEIYDYLRMLFARIGKTYSPVSGQEVKKHSIEDVVQCFLSYPDGIRMTLLAPLEFVSDRPPHATLDLLLQGGYSRAEYKGEIVRLEELSQLPEAELASSEVFLLIDRTTVSHTPDAVSRMTDSVETAFYEGHGGCVLRFYGEEGVTSHTFSNRFEADGMTFEEPSDLMFNFNSPAGACPTCEGFGRVIGIDEDLVIPDKSLSVYDDAVVCWKGEKMSAWKRALIEVAEASHFPIHRPYYQLTDAQRALLWNGNGLFHGIHDFFRMVEENQYKIQYRVMLARYRGKTLCPTCHGGRLKPEAQYVRVGGKSISELVECSIDELRRFFGELRLDSSDALVAQRLLVEINNRLQFLSDVGLSYLTLNRLSSTLSGGESQRINLATSLGSSLVGSLYILDEPSIGLHSRDTAMLIQVLRRLQQQGNTVIVVEHDEEIIRAADYIIDIGPQAGRLGGRVVYQGDLAGLSTAEESYTARYLTGKERIAVPDHRRLWHNYIEIAGVVHNNLKNITVRFPLYVMTVVTGVSGSGKSSLVRDVFYRSLARYYNEEGVMPGTFGKLSGDMALMKHIEFVDQNPIGHSSRSNPSTYLKAFDEIRKLFAEQPLAKQMGFTAAYFSFNIEGGRCEECKGEGTITVEMQFMADLVLPCEACHGKRFKSDILEVEYRGKNISDVLDMTVNQAVEFFSESTGTIEKKIVRRLKPLQDVGLGYIKMGQTSSTLSGGENQRVKLAYFLGSENQEPTIFVFDEPTTGLHIHDIKVLLAAFDNLITNGHTVVVIEHNLEVIKCADYLIDMGPEGGDAGGEVVCCGTPEEVAECSRSYTGKYLKGKLFPEN